MTITKELKIQLLKFFKFNKDIKLILDLGYEVSQIADFISQLESEKLLSNKNNAILLTKKGDQELTNLLIKSTPWIREESKSKIDKIDKNDVFLPRKYQL